MNIKQLKKKIKNLPDEMEIGSRGHFGDLLEVESGGVEEITATKNGNPEKAFIFEIEERGPEPD